MPKQEFLSPKKVVILKEQLSGLGKSYAKIAMEAGINPAYFSRRLSSGRITVSFFRRIVAAHPRIYYVD